MENNMSSRGEAQVFVGIKEIGGPSGNRWVYKPATAIKKIVVCSGLVVDSLIFISENDQHSTRFGGSGGGTATFDITYPVEYLTCISGTFGMFDGWECIKSLQFHTNLSKYGPFGRGGGSPFSLSVEDGSGCSLVGFHGRAGAFVNAIGFYARPPSSAVLPTPMESNMSSTSGAMVTLSPRNPGPFGGAFGREWDDGVFTSITKIVVHVDKDINAIRCVTFEYATGNDGNGVFLSPRHGDASSTSLPAHRIYLDYTEEFLMGISGYYSPVEGMDTIRSLGFMTNKGLYGPFGSQVGTYFCSPQFPAGKIVGFFGRASYNLHSIGVHMSYQRDEGV